MLCCAHVCARQRAQNGMKTLYTNRPRACSSSHASSIAAERSANELSCITAGGCNIIIRAIAISCRHWHIPVSKGGEAIQFSNMRPGKRCLISDILDLPLMIQDCGLEYPRFKANIMLLLGVFFQFNCLLDDTQPLMFALAIFLSHSDMHLLDDHR